MRLAAAVVGLLALGLASDDQLRAGRIATDRMLVIYVGADDCAPCRTWRRHDKARLLDEIEGRAAYREVIAPKLRQVFDEEVWPSDLRPFRDRASAVAGVPLWLVIRDEDVVATAGGLSRWRTGVLPAVRRLSRSREGSGTTPFRDERPGSARN